MCKKISWNEVVSFRSYCQEVTKDELDLVMKTELFAQRNTSPCVRRKC